MTLTFFGFFGKNVSFERLLMGDFSAACNFKSFFGAGIRFYLWHFLNDLLLLPAGVPHRRTLIEPCGKSGFSLKMECKGKDLLFSIKIIFK
jgi:hypothetical protein